MKFLKFSSALLVTMALLFSIGCASTETRSSAGEFIDDTVITTRVKAAIFNDPVLKVAEINVETFKSVVQLSGFVSTRADVVNAGALARSIAGVESVRNDIIIK